MLTTTEVTELRAAVVAERDRTVAQIDADRRTAARGWLSVVELLEDSLTLLPRTVDEPRVVDSLYPRLVAAMHSVDWFDPVGPYFATATECIEFAREVERARAARFSPTSWDAVVASIVFGWCYTARCEHARASVGYDHDQFGMRRRLALDGRMLLDSITG
jgi:hypothetical protein